MPDTPQRPVDRLFALIERLRAPDGCPWDRAQKLEDIVSDLVEEAYELEWSAAHHGDPEVLDEMGDVLFVLCMAIAVRAETRAEFTIDRIAEHAYEKIYRRHPHVFGDAVATTPKESIAHWEEMKSRERETKSKGTVSSALDGVAGNLPPLRHAEKVQERAASVGFDWKRGDEVIAKIREEIDELESALRDGDREHIQSEAGDLLFSVVNFTRFLKLDTERSLNLSTSRFIRRFRHMEDSVQRDGRRFGEMSTEEMNAYWERAKSSE